MPTPDLTTVRQLLYWAYGNLAMAQSAVDLNQGIYSRKNRMERLATFNGLTKGTRTIRSSVQDARNRLVHGERTCSYCGSEGRLALDHIFPRKMGGPDDAENLVTVCRSCNSSKGKKDLMEWMHLRGRFLPLTVIKGYLKLTYAYCVEHDLIDRKPEELQGLELSFCITYLPLDYPDPGELSQFPMPEPRTIRPERARSAVGEIRPGCSFSWKCQFSLIELVDHLLTSTGPVDLKIGTWGADLLVVEHLAQLQREGRILDTQWVLPTRFPGRDPECCDALLGHFGADRMRFGDGFSLCLLMSNSDWHLCIFSDLPLGTNRGIVGIQVEDCPERFRDTLEGDFLRDFALGRTIEETRKSLDQSFGRQGQFDS